jgi:hypothetical protein
MELAGLGQWSGIIQEGLEGKICQFQRLITCVQIHRKHPQLEALVFGNANSFGNDIVPCLT